MERAAASPAQTSARPFIYNASQVELLSTAVITDANPAEADAFAGDDFSSSRLPLVGLFRRLDNGVEFTVINVHMNSKGGDGALFGNQQPPVLTSELQRNEQAKNIRDYVQGLLSANPDANIMLVGDVNDFYWSNPNTTLEAAPLTNLAEYTIADARERYSYNFQGNAQELDHTMVSSNIRDNLLGGFDIVHINAEFSDSDRVSDHDPGVTLLDLRQAGENLAATNGTDAIEAFGGNDTVTLTTLGDAAAGDSFDGGAGTNDTLRALATMDFRKSTVTGFEHTLFAGSGSATVLFNDTQAAGMTFTGRASEVDRVSITMTSAGNLDYSSAIHQDIEYFNFYTSAGDDTLTGTGLRDYIFSKSGNDLLKGGAGNDIYNISNTAAVIEEMSAAGDDYVYASVDYTLAANVERLYLTGSDNLNGSGNDDVTGNRLYGNAGANELDGLNGDDFLYGFAGVDVLAGGNGADQMFGGDDGDTLHGGADNDRLSGDSGNDTLNGDAGSDRIMGGDDNDLINGGADADILYGDAGNDTINGGAGIDVCFGGIGADIFVLQPLAADRDVIRDFSLADADRLSISRAAFGNFDNGGATPGSDWFQTNTTGLAEDASDRFIYNQSTGALYFDANGTGSGGRVHIATLATKPLMTDADFGIFEVKP